MITNLPGPDMYDDWQDWATALVNELERVLGLVPEEGTGKLGFFSGATVPSGYLLCNGGSFAAASYPGLASFLGGTTLPNYTSPLASSVVGIKT